MNPKNMDTLGLAVIALGALFIALGGAYFYDLFQTISTVGATGTTADLARLSNSMLANAHYHYANDLRTRYAHCRRELYGECTHHRTTSGGNSRRSEFCCADNGRP